MRLELSPEQAAHKAAFRDFVDSRVVPLADQNDKEEWLPRELIREMAARGYLGAMLPRDYGGMGLDMVTVGVLAEELGRGWTSLRNLLTVHGMAALGILRWGTDEQRNEWLPRLASGAAIGAFALSEPSAGSDAKSIATTATLDGDEWVLQGRKRWITMGQTADLFIVFAQAEGKPTAFLVEKGRPGFAQTPIFGMLGMRASMLAELSLDQCRIPRANLLGNVGAGMSHVALSCLDYGRYTIACGCVGLGQACLESSVAYARERTQFGEPLSTKQLVQKMVTEMVVNVQAARLLCHEAGYLRDVGDPDSIMRTWVAKYFASTMVQKAASDAVQIHGANGCSGEFPIERYYRDAKINEIIEGTTQIHEVLIANNAFRSL